MTLNLKPGQQVALRDRDQIYDSPTVIFIENQNMNNVDVAILCIKPNDAVWLENNFKWDFSPPAAQYINDIITCYLIRVGLWTIVQKEEEIPKSPNYENNNYLKIYNEYRKTLYQSPLKKDQWTEDDLKIECERLKLI